jgi:hypothetical protein
MFSTLTTSIHPHCSLLRALFVVPGLLSTNMGRRSMTVRVLVGNQDVSPPMSDQISCVLDLHPCN